MTLTAQGGEKKRKPKRPSEIFSCLKLDINPYHHHQAALADAEYKFFTAKQDQEADNADKEEVDLFASDDEPAEAPVRVKPAGKSTNAKKDAKQAESKPNPAPAPASKTPEVPVEDKFLLELAQNPGLLRNPGNMERTFIMLKPDAVQRGLMGEIIERFETRFQAGGDEVHVGERGAAEDSLLRPQQEALLP